MEQYIQQVLAPRVQGDGGWVEFVSMNGNELTLLFRGECSKCPILNRCTAWIEQKIFEDQGQRVTVKAIRKKPFFWDNQ